MRDSLYDRYNDAEMYAEIGSDLPAANRRTYVAYVELGTSTMGARRFLSGALTNVTSKM